MAFWQQGSFGWIPAKKVVCWCGIQASVHYVQGIVNGLVNNKANHQVSMRLISSASTWQVPVTGNNQANDGAFGIKG